MAFCGNSPGVALRAIFFSSIAANSLPSRSNAQAASLRMPPSPKMVIFSLFCAALFDFRPGIAQSNGAVEHRQVRRGVLVHTKVTEPFELIPGSGSSPGYAFL